MPPAERKELGLGSWDTFFYLKQGGIGTVPDVDDAAEFVATQNAMSVIGLSVTKQWDIFRICAALLHIGNINIEGEKDADKMAKPLPKEATVVARDSVTKFIYSQLFEWIVKVININLARDDDSKRSFIGVLDIFGFEHFEKNSFEQFCINYANEKLQQEFNRHVFKLEQDLYKNEGLVWTAIDFDDNQECIDLIEGKISILSILDEESRLPAGKDSSLIAKYYQFFAVPTQKYFVKLKFGSTSFTVKHYANVVTYEIEGFVEKNRDTVSDEQLGVLLNLTCEFLKEVVTTVPHK
ncbi:Myosin type-2 heavy chain 1 [Nowakowskiella sp. JEL0407]|nr:Myosin type-2 heavy chain 1 [Nowakowskiella sp. JEL0407]